MKAAAATRAAELVAGARTAALGTLHDGAPSVTLVPYALVPDPLAFVVLVSELASHTRDMLADPCVALLMAAAEGTAAAHALPRVALRGRARALAAEDVRYTVARAAYAQRFPDMTGLFDLGDFRLFAIEPDAVRVVLGFAQAASLSPAALARALAVE